jgi:hypothetical protein
MMASAGERLAKAGGDGRPHGGSREWRGGVDDVCAHDEDGEAFERAETALQASSGATRASDQLGERTSQRSGSELGVTSTVLMRMIFITVLSMETMTSPFRAGVTTLLQT